MNDEIILSIETIIIKAKTRKLKAIWTFETEDLQIEIENMQSFEAAIDEALGLTNQEPRETHNWMKEGF